MTNLHSLMPPIDEPYFHAPARPDDEPRKPHKVAAAQAGVEKGRPRPSLYESHRRSGVTCYWERPSRSSSRGKACPVNDRRPVYGANGSSA